MLYFFSLKIVFVLVNRALDFFCCCPDWGSNTETHHPECGSQFLCLLFACWIILHAYFAICRFALKLFFWKKTTTKKTPGISSFKHFGSRSGRTFWLGLIWVQTFCKSHQRKTKEKKALICQNWIHEKLQKIILLF